MRIRKLLAGVTLGSALLVGGLAAPAQAASEPAQGRTLSAKSALGWYLYDYYAWKSDCNWQGQVGKSNGWWTRYECKNGSWVPGDDYELWVYS